MVVDRAAQYFRRYRSRQIEMRGLAERMHTGVGAPGTVQRDLLTAEPGDRRFERLLHRQAIRLALPADETGAVILDRQLVAGHGSTVPAAIGKPRRKADVSSGARPGRCSRNGRNTPSPQAIERLSSSTVPGALPGSPGRTMAASTRICSPVPRRPGLSK